MIKVIGVRGALAPVEMTLRRPKRNHCGQFKAKVEVAAWRSDKTRFERSEQFDVHANQNVPWKQQALEHLTAAFDPSAGAKTAEAARQALHAKLGQLTLAVDFLARACGSAGLPNARR